MLFNSFTFIALFAITFIVYYLPPMRKFQIFILIVASLIFYAWKLPMLTLVLLLTAAINAVASYFISQKPDHKKIIAFLGITANIAILVFFKYREMILNTFLPQVTSPGELLLLVPLPLGISFYIFKGISLLVDSLRADESKRFISKGITAHSIKSLLYISFFPQVLAGPIERAGAFFPQISDKRMSDIDWERCIKLIILGYFLKMVVADNLKDQTFWIAYPYFIEFSTQFLITMLFGYSIQMFADFAGYSLVAIGISALFGYHVKDNFLFPYISKSFSEFWRRWHISLSTFMRDYLYIPLGGNRRGKLRTYLNLVVVMFLVGLWHGAGWSYAFWGTLHGIALAIERFFRGVIILPRSKIVNALRMIIVFSLVSFAWIFFKLPNFSHVIKFIEVLKSNTHAKSFPVTNFLVYWYSMPVIIYHFLYLYQTRPIVLWLKKYEYALYTFLLFIITTNSGSPNTFIYFQF
jgi:alginate O-acetyltransferase complex protein AlgI